MESNVDTNNIYVGVLSTRHVSAVSHVSGIKIELLDRTVKMRKMHGHPIIFGQNSCYIGK